MTMLIFVIIYVGMLAGDYIADCGGENINVTVTATSPDTVGVFFLDCDASSFGGAIAAGAEYTGIPEACETSRVELID